MANQNVVRNLADGLVNVLTSLGTSADRRTQGRYRLGNVDLCDQAEVEAAYRTSGLVRKIHDLPPFDMTRAGRDWQAEKDQIEAIEAEERRLAVWPKLRRALTLARLYGGGAMILGLGDADPAKPLPANGVPKAGLKYLNVVSRHQLNIPDGIERDPLSPFFGEPKVWEMVGTERQVRIHPSRVIPFVGQPLPEGAIWTSGEFWGDPLLMVVRDAVSNSDLAQNGIAGLIYDAKNDVLKIPGLTNLVATVDGENKLSRRLGVAQQSKSLLNTLVVDKDEDWETRQLTWAGMPDIIRQFLEIVAAVADIPVTRLLGTSSKGLNATGEGDNDNYDDMIAARQKMDLAPLLDRLDAVLIPSAIGKADPAIYYEFAPLDQPTPAENADIEKKRAETVQIYANTQLVPDSALAKATQNAMVESGQWPGLDAALDEAAAAGELAPIMEEPDPAPVEPGAPPVAGPPSPTRVRKVANDAAPRTLYIRRDVVNAAEVIAWAKEQGFATTLPAADLHVTVAFSRTPIDWMLVGQSWSGDDKGRITVPPGGARLVEPLGDKGAVVLLFSSSELSWRHEDIKRVGASWDYDQYQPHVTITYDKPEGLDLASIEPYRGKIVLGPEIFEEVDEDWTEKLRES